MAKMGKVLLVIVLLLTWSAQAVAAVPASCDMAHGAHSDQPATDHHSHHADAVHSLSVHSSAEPLSGEENCCQPDGTCAMGSCAVYSVLPNTVGVSISQPLPAEITSSNTSFASIALASLYRPPIFH